MTTIGITMVRDEEDVIEGTIRHMAGEVDEIVVADNLSSDSTRQILNRLMTELPLTVVEDNDPAHYQSRKMSCLARTFAEVGDWVVPFDADELWYSPLGRVSEALSRLPKDATVAEAKIFNHYGTAVDPHEPDVFRRFVWRTRAPLGLPKIAFRYEAGAIISDGNHGVTLPSGRGQRGHADLGIRHFPYRSPEQFTRKGITGAAALELTSLPEDTGLHWRGYGAIARAQGEETLAQVYRDHFWFLIPWEQGLVRDPAPYRRWEL